MRALLISIAVGVLVAGCSDDGDDATVEAGPGTTVATSEGDDRDSTEVDAASDESAWCSTWAELRDAEEPTPEEIRGGPEVPSELRPVLDTLAEVMERSYETDEDPGGAELVRAMEASTMLVAWGHEHCGDDHPFCIAWPAASLFIAQTAMTPDDDGEAFLTEEEGVQLVGLALDHAPDGVGEHADIVRASLGTPIEDEQERAAEEAYDALDAWVDEHCEPLGE